MTVAEARALPLGTLVTVAARLTTPTGLTESGHGGFAQDGTGGIALYLTTAEWPAMNAGADLILTGTLETRYSLLTLRLADASAINVVGAGVVPDALPMFTGQIGELVESQIVTVQATVTDGISTLTDGFSTAVDDGSGALRVIASAITGISADLLPRGALLQLTGVVGQRDTSGTGAAGYRLHLRSAADIVALAPPSPSATPMPTPAPTSTASPAPTATATVQPTSEPTPTATALPTATPTPSPATTPAILTIASARALAVGLSATIQGTVTVEADRLPDSSLICVQDASGGIFVNLPAGAPAVARGDIVLVTGALAAPYGNVELRPTDGSQVEVVGAGVVPGATHLAAAQIGEANEGLLASVAGTLTQIDSTTTSLTLFIDDGTGAARIFITSDLGIVKADFTLGSQLTVTGLVADRLGLYRMWPRDQFDIVAVAPPTPSPSPTPTSTAPPTPTPPPSATPTPPPAPEVMAIAAAVKKIGQTVAITATVTSPTGLLDADGRRVTVEDSSGAILVRLPEATNVRVGDKFLIIGEIGTYYGAPQLAASDAPLPVAGGKSITPTAVKSAPIASKLEWRLVTVTGGVMAVAKDGDNWHAELAIGGGSIPIAGISRSAIPSTALVVGRTATVVGIVKRAYPTASDQRMAIVPRSPSDITLGGAAPKNSGVGAGQPNPAKTDGSVAGTTGGEDVHPGNAQSAANAVLQPLAIPISDIANHENEMVIVGGRIDAIDGNRLLVNDDTSLVAVRVPSTAGLAALKVGALVNARGHVTRTDQGGLEVVVDTLDAIRVLGAQTAVAAPSLALADSKTQPSVGDQPAALQAPPASSAVPLVIGGLLVLAFAVGAFGIAIARRPDLVRTAIRAATALRAQK